MAKLSELQSILAGIRAQAEKAKSEILARIAKLEAALADVEIPAAAQEELAALKADAQALDDINPDAPETPPVPPVAP